MTVHSPLPASADDSDVQRPLELPELTVIVGASVAALITQLLQTTINHSSRSLRCHLHATQRAGLTSRLTVQLLSANSTFGATTTWNLAPQTLLAEHPPPPYGVFLSVILPGRASRRIYRHVFVYTIAQLFCVDTHAELQMEFQQLDEQHAAQMTRADAHVNENMLA